MEQQVNTAVELQTANNVFAWFQSTAASTGVVANALMDARLKDYVFNTDDPLTEVREYIDSRPEAHRVLLRLYFSGFSDDIILELSDHALLAQAAADLSDRFPLSDYPADEQKQVQHEQTPTVEISAPATKVDVPTLAVNGAAKAKRKRPQSQPVQHGTEAGGQYINESAPYADDHEVAERLADTWFSVDAVGQWLQSVGKIPVLTSEAEVNLAKEIEVGLFPAERLNQDIESLSQESQQELEYLVKRGNEANQLMMKHNYRLVVWISKQYRGRGMPFEDLIQEGNLGLIRAVEKFDYKKGYKFSTYANRWIRSVVSRALADQVRTIRVPVPVGEVINKMERFKGQFLQEHGRYPTTAELASELDMTTEKLVSLQRNTAHTTSYNASVGEDGDGELLDILADKSDGVDTATQAINYELPEAILRILSTLSEEEAFVITQRLGLRDGEERTLDEVGKMLGLSAGHVRRIEQKTLSKIRHPSRSYHLRAYFHGLDK